MYVKCRPIVALYREIIGLLALVASWSLFVMMGASAWRLFMTWALILASIYYIFSGFLTIIMVKWRDYGWTMLPTWQLATIIALGLVLVEKIIGQATPLVFGNVAILIQIILPCLVLLDWLCFSKKGAFRLIDPWYALALPACYAAWITLSAPETKLTPSYPYVIFDFNAVPVSTFIWWLIFMMVSLLLASYIIYIVDFMMSGKVSRYIVMPKIKLVEIEDDPIEDDAKKPQPEIKVPAPKVTETKVAESKPVQKTAPLPKVDIVAKSKAPATTPKDIKDPKEAKDVTVPQSDDNKLPKKAETTKVTEPKKPEKPKEPSAPNAPHIENRKKDLKSAQSLHGDHK